MSGISKPKWLLISDARYAPKDKTEAMTKGKMLKKVSWLLILLGMTASTLSAQLADKAVFFGGFTYQFVSVRLQGDPAPAVLLPSYGLALGMDYVLLHSNDQFSIGVNPNINLGVSYNSVVGFNVLAQAPVFMLARFGAGSTPYNEQKFGIGAGIGAVYSYYLDQFNEISNGFVNPSAVVEIGIRSRMSDYLFRFNWSLMRATVETGNPVLPYQFGLGGLSIMYYF